jgi:hypothetical protein
VRTASAAAHDITSAAVRSAERHGMMDPEPPRWVMEHDFVLADG